MNNVAKVFNMTGANSAGAAQSAVNAHNLASDAHEKKFAGKQDRIESLPEKNVLADADTLPLTDSEEQNAGKRISWANIKAMLGKLYVPMTRRINNRALSADVTLTGDDIKTSATDETSISAALSNKVNLPISIPAAADLNEYTIPGMYFCKENGSTVKNTPAPAASFSLFVEKTGAWGTGIKQTFTHFSTGETCQRVFGYDTSGTKGPWVPLATATPPQVHNLPLLDGYSLGVDGAGYSKTQEGIVSIYFSVYGTFTAPSSDIGGEAFAILPEGFRPTGKIPVPVVQQDIPGPDWVKVIVHPDGSMRYYGNGSTTAIYGSVSFVASA